ncbi:MAG TPA: S16 family serine protease, partial [Methanobacterium sp.]|nr:S16 family serine protease [Methanobacterium sp.]
VLAAHRAGINRIILPKDNENDLDDVPQDVKDEIEFIFAETVEDVIKETIGIELPKPVIFDMTAKQITGGAGA